jgi:hypothetical protein
MLDIRPCQVVDFCWCGSLLRVALLPAKWIPFGCVVIPELTAF